MGGTLEEAEQLFERGKALVFQDRFREAAEILEAVVALAPGDGATRILLAVSRFNSGDYVGSLAPAAFGAYMEPSHAVAHTILGEALRQVGRPEDAARHLARAAWLGNPQAASLLAEMDQESCGRCGGAVDPAARCRRCAGEPPPTGDPRHRSWAWSALPESDYRSGLSLPSGELADLGGAYVTRYREQGDAEAIEEAILYLELAAAAGADAERATPLTELGVTFRLRFLCYGIPVDLDYAIDCHEQALSLTEPRSQTQAQVLGNISVAYAERYKLGGLRADLDRGIALVERGLEFSTPDWEIHTALLANAGELSAVRFARDGAPADLDRAIELQEQVAAGTPADHPRLAGRLSNLAAALVERYRTVGARSDLRRSIGFAERAVDETPVGHPARAIRLGNLGNALLYSCDRTPNDAELSRAISALRQAYETTPEGSPASIRMLSQLLDTYLRPDAALHHVDRAQLRAHAARLASAVNAPVLDRVRGGRVVGALANAVGDFETATEVLDATIGLLPSIAARGADWADRDRRAGEYLGLVGHAVTAHCARGDLVGAVQIAELGRGLQLAEQLDARSDLSDLEQQLPEYAQALGRVRTLLGEHDGAPGESQAPLWTRYEDLLAQIRGHHDFERFLLPPDLSELRRATGSGTVVMINAGRERSDAVLVLAGGELVHVPLPDLRSRHVVDFQTPLLTLARGARDLPPEKARSPQATLSDVLAWLWETAVGPIHKALLDNTGAEARADGAPRRVWWLPIGAIGAFPLHAAGYPGQPGALDALVSSYTPTLRVLAHAHGRRPAATRRQLTVALAEVPGLPTIPGTIAEARTLHRDHPEIPPLLDGHATVGRVKSALPEATWAHFACHASADRAVPSRSGLHLADGVLTVPEVSRLQLADAELAYLSACSTAHRSDTSIDESVNLASAFHLAGFRHVVASLWPLDDAIAAQTANSFYARLADTPDGSGAAAALRAVTLELQGLYPDRQDFWAALIHSGP
ncbi:tetratricopeptide (TPR) repeat protein [Catenulispora sp. EB89]|uniref:CHAT domain-containing protein n=1 Tax=Catenulispora sp. EB89 TaxID=3156257 RepID=UPI0035170F3F